MSIKKDHKRYKKFTIWKDKTILPLTKLLTFLRVTPTGMSLVGVVLMVIFVYLAPKDPHAGILLIVLMLLADGFDGPLARFQKVASDRGKLIDMIADVSTFSLFTMGIIRAELIPGFIGGLLVYAMILSKVVRCIVHAPHLKTDWYFKPVAGAFPNMWGYLTLLSFIIDTLAGTATLFYVASATAFLLVIDMVKNMTTIAYQE